MKESQEFEVIVSDRMRLVEAANVLVEKLIQKVVWPTLNSAVAVDTSLDEMELVAYRSALRYLADQFCLGDRPMQTVLKKTEREGVAT